MSYSSLSNFKKNVKDIGMILLIFTMVYGIVYLIHRILLVLD